MPKKSKSNKRSGSIRRIISIQRDLEELEVSKYTVKLEVKANAALRLNQAMTRAAESEAEFNAIMSSLTEEGKKSPMLEAFETAKGELWKTS